MGLAIFKGYISMISGWMENGDLMSYLRLKPDADRIKLVCRKIFIGRVYELTANGFSVWMFAQGYAISTWMAL